MAPIDHASTAQAESAIRETIQSLYNVMLHTANYDATGPHTTLDALVREVGVLAQALRDVSTTASDSVARPLPAVPRDLVQYVEDGRNPDIYTREFVELVRKTNQIRAGKQASFAQFQAVLARQIRSALPELSGDVDRVVAATGGVVPNTAGAATSTTAPAITRTDSSRDDTPGVLTPGGSTPGPNAAVPAAAAAAPPAAGGVAAVDMLGILPSTPQPGVGAPAPSAPNNQDTQ